MKTFTRFDLEEQIQQSWSIVDDIKLLQEKLSDTGLTQEEIVNYLAGLQAIYNLKFENMFHTFEQLVAQKKIL